MYTQSFIHIYMYIYTQCGRFIEKYAVWSRGRFAHGVSGVSKSVPLPQHVILGHSPELQLSLISIEAVKYMHSAVCVYSTCNMVQWIMYSVCVCTPHGVTTHLAVIMDLCGVPRLVSVRELRYSLQTNT